MSASLPAAAEQAGFDERAVCLVQRDDIVAFETERRDRRGVRDRRRAAHDLGGATVQQDLSSRIAADGDRVVGAVTECTESRSVELHAVDRMHRCIGERSLMRVRLNTGA